jgi:hypothetical protein
MSSVASLVGMVWAGANELGGFADGATRSKADDAEQGVRPVREEVGRGFEMTPDPILEKEDGGDNHGARGAGRGGDGRCWI